MGRAWWVGSAKPRSELHVHTQAALTSPSWANTPRRPSYHLHFRLHVAMVSASPLFFFFSPPTAGSSAGLACSFRRVYVFPSQVEGESRSVPLFHWRQVHVYHHWRGPARGTCSSVFVHVWGSGECACVWFSWRLALRCVGFPANPLVRSHPCSRKQNQSEKRKNQAAEAGPVLRVADPLLPPSPSSECCLRFGHQTISTWI